MIQKNPINETVNTFFQNWSTTESPVQVLGLLLNTYLTDPFSDCETDKEEVISERITSRTVSVGAVMSLLNDIEENQHVQNYASERTKRYFENHPQRDQDNIRKLLIHYIYAFEKQSFEVALTVPVVGAIMELLTKLQKAMHQNTMQPIELN